MLSNDELEKRVGRRNEVEAALRKRELRFVEWLYWYSAPQPANSFVKDLLGVAFVRKTGF